MTAKDQNKRGTVKKAKIKNDVQSVFFLNPCLLSNSMNKAYVIIVVKDGLKEAAKACPMIRSGVNCYLGKLTNCNAASAHGYEYTDIIKF